ncbi:hypothetical protein FACS1894206_05990 [Deltaproteobacteria bacterium]|nr:hypothetical protein FACS1894206_05990 [Deltaproteobacteria bacterium]
MRSELPPTAGLPLHISDFIRKPGQSFAQGLQRWLRLPSPLLTCSGTAALVIALKTLQQREPRRAKVIIPAYTCPLAVLAAQLVPGLRVVVCDTRHGSIDLDPSALAALCDAQTLAVMPTHLGGRVTDVATAKEIAVKHGAFVIEDAAQALGAFSRERSVGLTGDIGFFSLAAGKGLTTYEGGVLFSKDDSLAAELKATAESALRPHFFWNCRRAVELVGYTFLYRPSMLRHVYGRRLQNLLAQNREVEAVGDYFTTSDIPLHSLDSLRLRVAANALERLPEFLAQGRIRAAGHLARLRELGGVCIVEDRPDADGIWPFFMLLMPDVKRRDRVMRKLWTKGWGVSRLFIHALPDYAYLANLLAGAPGCANARDFASRMFTISNTPWLDDETFHHILQEVRNAL